MRQFGHVGEYYRLAQSLPLGVVGEGEPPAQRQQHNSGEQRPPGCEKQQTAREQQRQDIERHRR